MAGWGVNVGVGLLLHGSGWDELLMVAVGLVLALVVISVTGRRERAAAGRPDERVEEEEPGR